MYMVKKQNLNMYNLNMSIIYNHEYNISTTTIKCDVYIYISTNIYIMMGHGCLNP